MTPRHADLPHCEWPRATCHEPPLPREKNGPALCPEHFKRWILVMRRLVASGGVDAAKEER